MGKGKGQLRCGYVNVQGLNEWKWKKAMACLGHGLDLLFLAETWFVKHEKWSRDRRFITASDDPRDNKDCGRRGNKGLYLVGTAKARARIQGVPIVTADSITVCLEREVVTGVYFPPSMEAEGVKRQLKSLRTSTIVIGDINTRFRLGAFQSGDPGPQDRLDVVEQHLQCTGWRQLSPGDYGKRARGPAGIQLLEKLTVDHCFVHPDVYRPSIALWATASLELKTDHDYLLCLIVGMTKGKGAAQESQRQQLPRY